MTTEWKQPPALGGEPETAAWLDLEKLRAGGMTYATNIKVNHRQAELIDRAHVAPLLAEIDRLKERKDLMKFQRNELMAERDTLKAELADLQDLKAYATKPLRDRCAELDTLKARCEDASELLDIWRTWLGASRESCDETDKVLWDRITAVVTHAAPAAKDDSPSTYVVESHMDDPKPMKDGE